MPTPWYRRRRAPSRRLSVPAKIVNWLCQNTGVTNSARVGDASVSAPQGILLPPCVIAAACLRKSSTCSIRAPALRPFCAPHDARLQHAMFIELTADGYALTNNRHDGRTFCNSCAKVNLKQPPGTKNNHEA